MRPSFWIVTLLIAAACGAPEAEEEDWIEDFSEAQCAFYADCASFFFYDEYSDMEDCVDEVREDLEDVEDFLDDNCDFDEERASECLSYLHGSCQEAGEESDDFDEACIEAWDCD